MPTKPFVIETFICSHSGQALGKADCGGDEVEVAMTGESKYTNQDL